MKTIFEPCRKRDHATCTRAYFDAAGEPVACGCSCHVQAGLFGDSKPSIQPDLFQTGKDAKSGSKLSLMPVSEPMATMQARRDARTMTPAEVRDAIGMLCYAFQIEEPILTWTHASRGRYHPTQRRIIIGGNAWRGIEASLIHEFAHHLNNCRGGKHHDAGFWKALRDTAREWYGDPARYAWGSEYPMGKKFAAGNGYRLNK